MSDPEPVSVSRIRQIISLIDLTNLNDNCDRAAIELLCHQSHTPVGYVAALCVWPDFVSDARKFLNQNSPVKLATVVNFPSGTEQPNASRAVIDKALEDGADEIDYVLPYSELIDGNLDRVSRRLGTIRQHIPDGVIVKVILESGVLGSSKLIFAAASIAIDQGADFIKTSTGKVPVNATPEAATIMLDVIAHAKNDVGFKAAGGIKTVDDANLYLNLAEDKLGQAWIDSRHFRFGASGLLQDALRRLNLASAVDNKNNY